MVKYTCYLCSQKAKSTCRVCHKPICKLHNYGSRLQRSICQYCEKDVIRKGKIALYYILAIIFFIIVFVVLFGVIFPQTQ